MSRKVLFLSLFLIIAISCRAGNTAIPERDLSAGDILTTIALDNLNLPYVAGTLEVEPEQLVIKRDKTDCILFVEMCVASYLNEKSGNPSDSMFSAITQGLRYRNGIIDGYCSRLHYTSEWVQQGINNGIFTDMTESIGGVARTKEIFFMSQHPDSYAQLKNSRENIAKIQDIESVISQHYYFEIPKESVNAFSDGICNGDIILFMTTVAGLDVSHVGIAYWNDGELSFIHASSKAGKVIINPESLDSYLQSQKSVSGIRIIRLN